MTKIITMATTRSRSPQTLAHCIFYGFGVTKEGSTHKGWNNVLLIERRDAAGSASLVCVHGQKGTSCQPTQAHWSASTPFVLQTKTFLPKGGGRADILVGLARCHIIHTCKQYKEVHCVPRTRERFLLIRKKSGANQQLNTHLPYQEICQTQDTVQSWRGTVGPMTAASPTAVLTNYCKLCDLEQHKFIVSQFHGSEVHNMAQLDPLLKSRSQQGWPSICKCWG